MREFYIDKDSYYPFFSITTDPLYSYFGESTVKLSVAELEFINHAMELFEQAQILLRKKVGKL